uniref:Uncharacterized protein n=1 Tax=Tanacetum cinerariifolium TaxID=118510 RepID=A0A699HXG2_TANCI|nr:hypothetical protein [Tanacetum cinerariifolium]
MIEPKKPLKKKDQIMIDEEVARNLEAQMQDELLQEEKIGELSIKEKSRLFVELMDKRKKHFARLKAEKIRSKPPTKAQKRNQMCTYLKNMANYNHNQLKNKSFEEIQMLFNNTIKLIDSFVSMDTELVKGSEKAVKGNEKAVKGSEKAEEGSSKRAVDKLEQENAKMQRIKEENKYAKLKRCLEIIPEDDDDVTIEATPLSSKYPTIVDYKIYKEGGKSNFKIIRAEAKNMVYYLLVEKMYPFTRNVLHQMWNDVRLYVDYEVEIAYDLFRLIRRQISKGYVPE